MPMVMDGESYVWREDAPAGPAPGSLAAIQAEIGRGPDLYGSGENFGSGGVFHGQGYSIIGSKLFNYGGVAIPPEIAGSFIQATPQEVQEFLTIDNSSSGFEKLLKMVGTAAASAAFGPAGGALFNGAISLAQGQTVGDALKGAALSYAGGQLMQSVGGMSGIADKVGGFLNGTPAGVDASWGVNEMGFNPLGEGEIVIPESGPIGADPVNYIESLPPGSLTRGVPFGQSMFLDGMFGDQAPAPVEDRTPTKVNQPGSSFNLKDAASIASLASAAARFLGGGANATASAHEAAGLTDGTVASSITDPSGAPLPPVVDPSVQAALDAAEAQRKAEADRADRIARGRKGVNDQFAGFNDDYYGSIADAYKKFHMPLLDEQAKEARRVLPFGTASTQSSAYQRQAGNLERDVSRQTADVGNRGVSFANTRRGEVENSRSGLLNLVQSGADVETVNSAAADNAKVFGTPDPYIQGKVLPTPVSTQQFSPISDLFAKYTADAANGAIAQRAGYAAPQFRSPLTFGSSGSGAVRNVA